MPMSLRRQTKNGCYIVTTDVDGAADITQQQRFGTIHPTHDWEAIGQTLQQVAKTRIIIGRYLCPASSICPQGIKLEADRQEGCQLFR